MKKIGLKVAGLANSQTQSGAFALVLEELGGARRLPVIIGAFEAQAIAMELDNLEPARPLTHDLFKLMAEALEATITEVLIYKLLDGVFYASLFINTSGRTITLDARTSDAIAIGLRFNADITIYEHIMDEAGIAVDEDNLLFIDTTEAEPSPEPAEPIKDESAPGKTEMSPAARARQLEKLEEKLALAIANESFEEAAALRDKINAVRNNL